MSKVISKRSSVMPSTINIPDMWRLVRLCTSILGCESGKMFERMPACTKHSRGDIACMTHSRQVVQVHARFGRQTRSSEPIYQSASTRIWAPDQPQLTQACVRRAQGGSQALSRAPPWRSRCAKPGSDSHALAAASVAQPFIPPARRWPRGSGPKSAPASRGTAGGSNHITTGAPATVDTAAPNPSLYSS